MPGAMRALAEREATMVASKGALMRDLRETVALLNKSASAEVRASALLGLYERVTQHVNLVESMIAQDDLSGANDNERWRTFRAETALNLLDMYPSLHGFFRKWAVEVDIHTPRAFHPSRTAMASAQRLVAEVYPEEAAELEHQYRTLELPVHGFERSVPRQLPRDTASKASVEFAESGGLRAVSGLRSDDAVRVATGVAHRGPGSFSAPASPSDAASLLKAGHTRGDSWLRRQLAALADSPLAILVTVVATLMSSALLAWLGLSSP